MSNEVLDLKEDANEGEILFWLVSQLSNKQKAVLGACIEVADQDGLVAERGHPSLYQHIASITGRSPGYTNTAINELVWLGLLRVEREQRFDGCYEKRRNRERYYLVGWPYYESWHVQQILYSEKIRGKSNVVVQEQWQAALGAISQEVCHGA